MPSAHPKPSRRGRTPLPAVFFFSALVIGITVGIIAFTGNDDPAPTESERQPSADPPKPIRQGRATKISEIREAILLEGQEAMGNEALLETDPTFAARHEFHPDPGEMSNAVVTTQSSVPFLDSYVRWQMTSYRPAMLRMKDQRFAEFLSLLPPFTQDPRNDAQAATIYERSENVRANDPTVRERLESMDARLRARTDVASTLMIPGVKIREWYMEKLRDHPGRVLRIRADGIDRKITAGWPVADDVAQLDTMLRDAASRNVIAPVDVAALLESFNHLRDHARTLISDFTIDDDGTVTITRIRAEVPAATLDAWEDLLRDAAE